VSHERKSVLVDAFPDSALRHRERAAVVCIDVMLATTTLVSAAAEGRRAFVAATPEELSALAAGLDHPILAGRLEGGAGLAFAADDGPHALGRAASNGEPLLLASPPGTELICNASAKSPVLLACFRNLSATARALRQEPRVALLAAGSREEFGCEDQMAAAWIAERLFAYGFAPEDRRTAEIVKRWSGISPALAGWGNAAAELTREGRGEEVEFVIAHVDDVDRACVCEGRLVCLEGVTTGAGTRAGASRP
jgi:phosphosulfolactate phosphohydrolase-like enzyme